MKTWLKFLLADLAALLLGVTLTFAFAPYDVFPLALIAPAGLLALWLRASPKQAFSLGFVFGLGLFGAGTYWVYISIHSFGDVPNYLALFITSAFIAILALFPATVGYTLNRYFPTNNTTKIICAFPAIWMFSEWVRSWAFSGFPWLFLGYSQIHTPLKGYAAIFSVYGVSLAVLMTSALILNAIIHFRKKEYRSAYFSLLAFISIWILGSLLSLIPWTKPDGNPVSVSLVQGNIPQSLKWSPDHLQLSFDRYNELTEPLWGKSQLIIWPEAAIPLPLQNATTFIDTMDEKARASGSRLILGIPIQTPHANTYNNAVVTLGQDKRVYLKRRLVPFGEYTPFSNLFSHLFQFMNLPMADMVEGNYNQGPMILGNNKIMTSICYEIAFPELINFNDKTINMILTVTNDAWFGESNAEAQHLQMAQMRALELGRPVLFVSNDGITAIINSRGQIESSLPQRKTMVLNASVQPMVGMTPWMRNRTDPILFLLLCLLFTAIRSSLIQARKDKLSARALVNASKEQL